MYNKTFASKVVVFFSLLFFVFSLAYSAEAYEWPSQLSLTTHPVGHAQNSLANAWASVLEEDKGILFRVIPEGVAATRRRWMRTGRVLIESNAMSPVARDGIETTEYDAFRDGGPFPVRMIWSALQSPFGVIVRGDSDIKTIEDFEPGIRVANYEGLPAFTAFVEGVAAFAGLNPEEEIISVPVSGFAHAVEAVMDRRADYTYIGTTNPAVMEASVQPGGVRFIELNPNEHPEGAQRFLEYRPTLMFGRMGVGVEEARDRWGLISPSAYYVNNEYVDEDLVYNLVKWLDENHHRYKDAAPADDGSYLESFRSLLDSNFIPLHDGTIKFLKEKDMWTEEDELRQEYNLKLLRWYKDAYQEAIDSADEQGIQVDPTNEAWLTFWEDYKVELGIPPVRVLTEIPEEFPR